MHRIVLSASVLFLSLSAQAYTVDHVVEAKAWVDVIDPINNNYGEPASVTWSGVEPIVTAKCGSFQGLLFKETYSDIGDTLLANLTGSSSPFAIDWYDAILDGASSGGYALTEKTGGQMAEGDLLVTAYGDGTDHAMMIASKTNVTGLKDGAGIAYKKGLNTTDTIWLVGVYDASETPHGPPSTSSRPMTDTRYKYPDSGASYDQGIGYGEILVYTNASGAITSWRWSIISSTLYIVSGTAGTGQELRPLIAGRMSGPQI